MLYIHSLKDLAPKTADIESVPIIREIKGIIKKVFSEDDFKNLSELFPNHDDINSIVNSSKLIEPVIEKIRELINQNNPTYEAINLYRTVSMLEEVNQPLLDNIQYLEEIKSLRIELIKEVTSIFNSIASIKTMDERTDLNNRINAIFQKILRNNEFAFYASDVINEGKIARIKDLDESMANGFFFHVTVKEHLDKLSFDEIKNRIKNEEFEPVENITSDISGIKRGVQAAYDFNMKMVNLIVVLYSYIKVLIQ